MADKKGWRVAHKMVRSKERRMPKQAKELKAIEVQRLTDVGMHAVGRVAGLYLQISSPTSKSWVYRGMVGSKRREIGLGAYPAVTLAMAHAAAQGLKTQISTGVDTVLVRKAEKSKLSAEQARAVTFAEAARRFITDESPKWENAKHAQQWENTLATYAYPTLGALMVKDIDVEHIRAVIDPIWKTKAVTAGRLRGRIAQVLDWAALHKLRSTDNPAKALAKTYTQVRAAVKHFPALPHAQIGAFMAALALRKGDAAKCLAFATLTAARSQEARLATWDEIDLAARTWTIPAERMKLRKEHIVPLSTQAVQLLEGMPRAPEVGLVFVSPLKGVAFSDMALTKVLRDMNVTVVMAGGKRTVTQHGFRSTFRDWCAEETAFDRTTCEHALAHSLPDKTEAAYLRTTLLPKRKLLMQAWGERCYAPD
jgi:integrase